ncbi:hypothetical protein ACC754_39230, partial [Rhizobium johnstonii]
MAVYRVEGDEGGPALVLGWTGLIVWLERRRAPRATSADAGEADTILLVGSESGTTRGFANTLQAALS